MWIFIPAPAGMTGGHRNDRPSAGMTGGVGVTGRAGFFEIDSSLGLSKGSAESEDAS